MCKGGRQSLLEGERRKRDTQCVYSTPPNLLEETGALAAHPAPGLVCGEQARDSEEPRGGTVRRRLQGVAGDTAMPEYHPAVTELAGG